MEKEYILIIVGILVILGGVLIYFLTKPKKSHSSPKSGHPPAHHHTPQPGPAPQPAPQPQPGPAPQPAPAPQPQPPPPPPGPPPSPMHLECKDMEYLSSSNTCAPCPAGMVSSAGATECLPTGVCKHPKKYPCRKNPGGGSGNELPRSPNGITTYGTYLQNYIISDTCHVDAPASYPDSTICFSPGPYPGPRPSPACFDCPPCPLSSSFPPTPPGTNPPASCPDGYGPCCPPSTSPPQKSLIAKNGKWVHTSMGGDILPAWSVRYDIYSPSSCSPSPCSEACPHPMAGNENCVIWPGCNNPGQTGWAIAGEDPLQYPVYCQPYATLDPSPQDPYDPLSCPTENCWVDLMSICPSQPLPAPDGFKCAPLPSPPSSS
jgi:hypothetical protein